MKKLSKLKGIKTLSKNQQKAINGAGGDRHTCCTIGVGCNGVPCNVV